MSLHQAYILKRAMKDLLHLDRPEDRPFTGEVMQPASHHSDVYKECQMNLQILKKIRALFTDKHRALDRYAIIWKLPRAISR